MTTTDTSQRPATDAAVADLEVARRRAALTEATAHATTTAVTSAHRWAGRRAARRHHREATTPPPPLPGRWGRWWPHHSADHGALSRCAVNGPRRPVAAVWRRRTRRRYRYRSTWVLGGLVWTTAATAGAALALALLVAVTPLRVLLWVGGEILVLRGWHRPPRRTAIAERDLAAYTARRDAEIRTTGALNVPRIGPNQPTPTPPGWPQPPGGETYYWPVSFSIEHPATGHRDTPTPQPQPAQGWTAPNWQTRRRWRLSPTGRLLIGLLLAAYAAYLAFIAVGIGVTLKSGPPPAWGPTTSTPETTTP